MASVTASYSYSGGYGAGAAAEAPGEGEARLAHGAVSRLSMFLCWSATPAQHRNIGKRQTGVVSLL